MLAGAIGSSVLESMMADSLVAGQRRSSVAGTLAGELLMHILDLGKKTA